MIILKKFNLLAALFLCCLILNTTIAEENATENATESTELRDQILGNLLKNRLELMHYSHKKADDNLSEDAFKIFLDRLDHGKQYLLKSDIEELQKYSKSLGQDLVSGKFRIIAVSRGIYHKRLEEVHKLIEETLKTPFNFSQKEELESDPKKREYSKDLNERKELWRKILKYSTLNQYLSILEEEEEKKKALAEEAKAKGKEESKAVPQKKITITKKTIDPKVEKEAREKVLKNYKRIFNRLSQEDHDDELERYFNAITMAFDPHTNYLPPQKKEDFDIEMRGSLEGIGALLKEDGEYIKVVRIIPGSASWRQKQLEPEDTILKVAQGKDEPVDIVNMRINDAVKLIRGKKGTEVRLTVKKPTGRILVIPIIRDEVLIEDAYAKAAIIKHTKLAGRNFGYIYVPKFYRDFDAEIEGREGKNCTDDVREELKKFTKKKVDGVILDLRNNGGGALQDARLMSGLFIKSGPIVQVRYNNGTNEVLKDTDNKISYDGHLIVLINRFSASASEILAGALQDYERAVIVGGEHSHGKGTVQIFLNLDRYLSNFVSKYTPLGALKVTIQKFYRINGQSTQYKGVTPDIVLPDPYGHLETGEKYLDHSLPWDEVKPLSYTKWQKTKLFTPQLIVKSRKRVDDDLKFRKLNESLKIMTARRDKTVVSLNLWETKEEQDQIQEELDKFKLDEEDNNVQVFTEKTKWITKTKEPPKDKNGKPLSKEKAEREDPSDDWIYNLRKDPYITESMYILEDLIELNNSNSKMAKSKKVATKKSATP